VGLNGEVLKRNVDTPEELLACIVYAAACIKKREDQLRRTTRELRTRVAECIEVGGGVLGRLLCTVTSVCVSTVQQSSQ
jgi:hypothetical protein